MSEANVRPPLGGREADEDGINKGILRCPRCSSRLLCQQGRLKDAELRALWVPSKESGNSADAEAVAGDAQGSGDAIRESNDTKGEIQSTVVAHGSEALDQAGSAPDNANAAIRWSERPCDWWWVVEDVNDMDNVGLSAVVEAPPGLLQLVMCCECLYGPFGYQMQGDPQLWLCCDLLHQQDASLANDEDDFRAPSGIDMAMLQQMLASGMATTQFKVTFEHSRLGMMLSDNAAGDGVEVIAFTTSGDGMVGAAEASGKICIGDKLTRINGRSTRGMDYAAVLDAVIAAPRPLIIHFERKGHGPPEQGASVNQEVLRVEHQEWKGAQSAEVAK